ncbi:hypothetical protein GOODEAATRI_025305, partial [Goodea atripinnis]
DLTMETELEAVNGRKVRAIEVFAHALHFFREHALKVRSHLSMQHDRCEDQWYSEVTRGSLLGGEGPVFISAGRRGYQMGDHRPSCVETTSQAVYERGRVPGRTFTSRHHNTSEVNLKTSQN